MLIPILSLLSLMSDIGAPEMLKKADAFRSPQGGFEIRVEVNDLKSGDKSSFDVYVEGNDKSLMVTKTPQRDVGRNLLMLDRDLWIFLPNINRPVRVALQQRLVGQVANGDLSRVKWVGDYEAQIETKSDGKRISLILKASKPNLTYDQIRLWVSSEDFRPLKAEFLTPSGRLLKSMEFQDYGALGGAERPRKMKVQDAIKPDDVSVISINEMLSRKFSSGFFTQTNMARPRF